MEIACPKCGEKCEGENVSGHIGFDNYECECGFEFCYDDNRSEYYDIDGNVIKEMTNG